MDISRICLAMARLTLFSIRLNIDERCGVLYFGEEVEYKICHEMSFYQRLGSRKLKYLERLEGPYICQIQCLRLIKNRKQMPLS